MTGSIGAWCKRRKALSLRVLITHKLFFLRSYKTLSKSHLVNGGYTGIAPPDPFPNSEVKYAKADDTWFFLGK